MLALTFCCNVIVHHQPRFMSSCLKKQTVYNIYVCKLWSFLPDFTFVKSSKKKLAHNSCATHGKRYTFYYEKSLKLSGSAIKDFSLRPQAFSVLIFALKNNKR